MTMDPQSQRGSADSGQSRLQPEAKRHSIASYKEYLDVINDIDDSKQLFIFYIGTKSPSSGYSWCPTCIEASEAIDKLLAELQDITFLTVHVGSQEEWQDKTNPFRTDANINLRLVPTLLKYNSSRRLEGQYCLRPELLNLMFEDVWDF